MMVSFINFVKSNKIYEKKNYDFTYTNYTNFIDISNQNVTTPKKL